MKDIHYDSVGSRAVCYISQNDEFSVLEATFAKMLDLLVEIVLQQKFLF